jgi:beta-phosphoglucomutase-like phosphatase (HAD superfamily)
VIRAVLFDLDGTIWDSEIARFRSWQRVFEEHGQPYAVESFAQRLGTVGGPDPVDELWRDAGDVVEDPRDRLDAHPGQSGDVAHGRAFAAFQRVPLLHRGRPSR